MGDNSILSNEERAKLNERLHKLATEKSYLQLITHLMSKMSTVSGLENTIQNLLQIILENIGGSNLIIYYVIDEEIYYADVLGEKKKIIHIEDGIVKKVFETHVFSEVQSDFNDTKLLNAEFTKASTWAFPLQVGSDFIGVFKIEGLYVSTSDLHFHLPTFFTYAAHILKNEILDHTKLQSAFDQLSEENVLRKKAEEELRTINEELENRVEERTIELHQTNLHLEEELGERQQAEQMLLESEERYKRITAGITDYLYTVKIQNGKAVETIHNDACLVITGYTPKEFVDDPNLWINMVVPEDRALVTEHFSKIITGKNTLPLVHRIICKDRKIRWISDTPILKYDLHGRLISYDGVIKDITDSKQADERILKLNQELEQRVAERTAELETMLAEVKQMQTGLIQSEKMASLGQLTAGIAHEINNPLSFVSSNINRFGEYYEAVLTVLKQWHSLNDIELSLPALEKIKHDAFLAEQEIDLPFITEDFQHLLNNTRDGIERIRKIVEQLRGFTHLADSRFTDNDINGALDDTVTIVWNELKYKAVIEKNYSPLPPVSCNPGEIKQVFVNLLVNAAQAIEQKGTITIATEVNEHHVVIRISDTGSGIPEAHLKKIFDPFFTTKPIGKGTGLGLWIISTIIQKHRGTISVESEVGKGTTFNVTLPLQQA